jgi:hypothetical protein
MKAGVAIYHLIHRPSRNCRVAMKNLGNQPSSCSSQKLYEFIACSNVFLSFEFVKRWSSLFDNVTTHYEL